MDLGISGRWALVTGGSRGLGRACAEALAEEGAHLVINARSAGALDEACQAIAGRMGVDVRGVAGDITDASVRQSVLAAAPQLDILVLSGGGPPPGAADRFARQDWIAALDSVMLAPLELINASLDGMIDRRFGRIVNISAALVKAPLDHAAMANLRLALTGLTAGLARRAAEHNVTLNNLLHGAFETGRLEVQARALGIEPDAMRANILGQIPAARLGTPDELGRICAFLCSAHAGYLTRHNLLLDGGAHPGLL